MAVPLSETFSWFHKDVSNDTNYPINILRFPHVSGLNASTIRVGLGGRKDPRKHRDEPVPWQISSYDSLSPFSAVCYYFGKALYKRMAADGEVVPLGLVMNEWGGSLIESWVPERSASTGAAYCTDRATRAGRTPGKLFNSMIMPVSNTTMRGMIWYQGEQNGGNPGSYLNQSGYACLLPSLDDSWRRAFSEGSGTDLRFPIGVVSLHGWCGEEEAYCTLDPATRTDRTAEIRWAQTADWGFLPNPRLPYTFVAMAYDQPDPRNGTHGFWNASSGSINKSVPYPLTCVAGKEVCPMPAGLMGGNIHPRNKLLLGDRIARAAKAVAYGDDKVAFTGPVVQACESSSGGKLTLRFDATLLRGEALRVKVRRGFEVRSHKTGNWSFATISGALGVQAAPVVEVEARGVDDVDGIRYQWLDNPACPAAYCDWTKPLVNQSCANGGTAHHRHDTDRNFWWCFNPTETIALYTADSELPAPPFTLEIAAGKCVMSVGVNGLQQVHGVREVRLSAAADALKTEDAAAMRPWMNASLTRPQRLQDLVGSMTTAEKLTQLVHMAPGVARVGLPAYVYSGTCNHGEAGASGPKGPLVSTVFPQSLALAESWDLAGIHAVANEAERSPNEAME